MDQKIGSDGADPPGEEYGQDYKHRNHQSVNKPKLVDGTTIKANDWLVA
jgi:hypothetical protein